MLLQKKLINKNKKKDCAYSLNCRKIKKESNTFHFLKYCRQIKI